MLQAASKAPRDYALQRGLLESAAAAAAAAAAASGPATEMEEHRGHLRNMYEAERGRERGGGGGGGLTTSGGRRPRREISL